MLDQLLSSLFVAGSGELEAAVEITTADGVNVKNDTATETFRTGWRKESKSSPCSTMDVQSYAGDQARGVK